MLTFNPLKAVNSTNPINIPCGNCTGCRIDRVDQWATRCYHESQMHEHNSFLTLTYSNDHLPDDYGVSVRTFQLFMKRLRFEIFPTKIRYFGCGEYGEQTLRPHYHALIFGYAFPDREFHSTTTQGDRLYSSTLLSKAWPYGNALIGDVTIKSAGYVAGYCMKKITGDLAASHYLRTHPRTGLVNQVEPEFALQSSRPGIGAAWFERFKSDAFPSDFVVVDGRQKPVPRYYVKKLTEEETAQLDKQRLRRQFKADAGSDRFNERKANRSKERLAVRETIKKDRLSRLVRTLKDDQ